MIDLNVMRLGALTTGKDPAPVLIKSEEFQLGMLIVMATLALTVFIYAFNRWRLTKRSDMVWISIGAMAAVFYEPLGDSIADLVYHQNDSLHLFSAFGVSIPMWVLPSYVVFWGPGIVALTSVLEKGVSRQKWFSLYAAAIIGTWLFEVPLIRMGLYSYYGSRQAFKILDYPVWMAFSNSCVIFVVAMLVHLSKQTTAVRERPALLAFLVPSFIIAMGVTTLVPIGIGMSSSSSLLTINIFGIATIILSTAYVWVAAGVLNLRTVPERRLQSAVA